MNELNFTPYDDMIDVKGYDGFIDTKGNFYKVCSKNKNAYCDTHNNWAEEFIKRKLSISDIKLNATVSALFALSQVNGPAEFLVNCFGYVYYSHDPFYYKPIIKLPNPKVAKLKVTEDQLDSLFSIMILNNEDTNIPVFFDEDCYD